MLFLANRYPFFSKEQLNKIIHSVNANDVYSIIKKIAYDDDVTEIIQKLQKECNVKFSKNVIKRFIEDPSSVADIMTFGEYFTNIDLLNRFIDSGLCSIIKMVAPVFIEKIIELRGEPQAMNFFMKGLEDETILRDASNCYVSFSPRHEYLLTPNMLRGNLFEVHDKLSEAANNIRYPNESIFYQQEEKDKYEKNVEGIKFALPKTTHELIYIGQELHNCVATYAPKAVSKECTIVYMEQNGELVGCIEIDTTGKYIIQARGHCNELFEGELLRIFNKYAAITGLSNNCA